MPPISPSKQTKLIKTDDFSSVFNFRKRITGKYLVFHYKFGEQDQTEIFEKTILQNDCKLEISNNILSLRVGLAVAKKVAKHAVDRNYMKRVLRELVRVYLSHTIVSKSSIIKVDIVIRVQKIYSNQQFTDIKKEFNQIFNDLLHKLN